MKECLGAATVHRGLRISFQRLILPQALDLQRGWCASFGNSCVHVADSSQSDFSSWGYACKRVVQTCGSTPLSFHSTHGSDLLRMNAGELQRYS
jgi:hypothetical protein